MITVMLRKKAQSPAPDYKFEDYAGKATILAPRGIDDVGIHRATKQNFHPSSWIHDLERIHGLGANARIILGYLGFTITMEQQRSQRVGELRYRSPHHVANQIVQLNRLLPPGNRLVDVFPYDGGDMPAAEYIENVAHRRLPITTGRRAGATTNPGPTENYPHAEGQIHDYLTHLWQHLATPEAQYGELTDFLKEEIRKGPNEVVKMWGTRPATRAMEAGDLIENHWAMDTGDTPYQGIALGIMAVRQSRNSNGDTVTELSGAIDEQELASLERDCRDHVALVANVIRREFPEFAIPALVGQAQ